MLAVISWSQQNRAVTGNVFNIALVPCCTQLISCSFVYGCHRCEIKRELVSPWSLYPVLEKRLGRYPKPCLIMVETCSITIVTSMKHSSYKKRDTLRKEEREKKITIFPWYIRRIDEMLIVCLPCHFGEGKAPVPCARGTPLAVLNDMQILIVTRTCMGPKLSIHEV